MSYLKIGNITGVNNAHPLAANLVRIWDIGGSDTEVISGTPIETPATFINDPVLGPCREFTNELKGFTSTLAVPRNGTIVFVYRGVGLFQEGGDSIARFANFVSTGDVFRIEYRGFYSRKWEVSLRAANISQYVNAYNGIPTDQADYEAPSALAVTVSRDPVVTHRNGAVLTPDDPAVDLGGDYANATLNLSIFPEIAPSATQRASAIFVFDRVLTPAESASFTADPMAIATMEVQPTSSIDVSELTPNQQFVITCSNFPEAPNDSVDFIGNGAETVNVPVTVASQGEGSYTMTGTYPNYGAVGTNVDMVRIGPANVRIRTGGV